MLKPTFGNVPKLQTSIDELIKQLELYREYQSDCMQYDLATGGFDEEEANSVMQEYEEEDKQVLDFINKLKSMSVLHDKV